MALLYKHCFSLDDIYLIWSSSEHDLYTQERIDRKRETNKKIVESYRNVPYELIMCGDFLWFPTRDHIVPGENGDVFEDISNKPTNYTTSVRLNNDKEPRILFSQTEKGFLYHGAYKAVEVVEKENRAFITWRKCFEWEYDEREISRKLAWLRLIDRNTVTLQNVKVLYCHGLASRGNSDSANFLRQLGADVISPDIPLEPLKAISLLQELANMEVPDIIVGTSMGGMLAQKIYGYPKVLVNPAFHVSTILRSMIGTNRFFHRRDDGATTFEVTTDLCDEYERIEAVQFNNIPKEEKQYTVALFGTKDDVLNWEQVLAEYLKHYNFYSLFDGGHRLTKTTIQKNVCLKILQLIE